MNSLYPSHGVHGDWLMFCVSLWLLQTPAPLDCSQVLEKIVSWVNMLDVALKDKGSLPKNITIKTK